LTGGSGPLLRTVEEDIVLGNTTPYHRELGNGLVLKSIADDRDLERVAAFNGAIHDPGVADMARELVLHHPNTRPEQWLYVEDTATSEVVSALCLIPWTWRYEEVQLRVGEVGLVGTLPAYRHRGLIREQFARHEELLGQGGYDLGIIQGIPYFYRQFGYQYAIPLVGGRHVELHAIPQAAGQSNERCAFRQAESSDIPTLLRLYDEAAQDLSISTVRDQATWHYLLGPSRRTEMTAETWLVLEEEQPVGYWRIYKHGFGEGLIVGEASRLKHDQALAVLHKSKTLAIEREKPYIRLDLPESSTLTRTARYLDAHDIGRYAWQIHLVDVGRFLLKLAPVLERRIAASPFAGLTQKLCFNLYRQAFEMRFQDGRLAAVEPLGFRDPGEIRLPPMAAVPLLLGYRSRQELQEQYPDISIAREWHYLVDVMFPKVDSFIYTIY
jgi:hypothetical protein